MPELLARKFFQAVAFILFFLGTTISLSSSSCWSQTEPGASEAKPLALFVPPSLPYSSVFENYHGYQDQGVASWLDANETVGRIGGWRHYLEEASQPHQHPVAKPKDTHHHSGHGAKP